MHNVKVTGTAAVLSPKGPSSSQGYASGEKK